MALSKIKANSITDDSITVDQIADTAVHGRRNLVINGAMQVAQRGTVTGVTNNYGGPDRFVFARSGAAAATLSQDTDVPSGYGFANSFKIDITTADSSLASSDYALLAQRFEGLNLQSIKKGTSNAEKLTASFWIKSSTTGTYILEVFDSDNTRQVSASYSVSTADTWEHKVITLPADTTGTIDDDDANSLTLTFWLAAGSAYSGGTLNTSWAANTSANRAVGQVNAVDDTANNIYFTGVQLEVGEKATPFDHQSFSDELLRCQRYCVVARAANTDTTNPGAIHCNGQRGHFGFGLAHNSTNPVTYFELPVTMRNRPGVSFSAVNDFAFDRGWAALANYTNIAIQSIRSSTNSVALIGTTSGLSNGNAGSLSGNPDITNAKITFSAEL